MRVCACVRDPRHHVLIPKASLTITKKTPIEVPTTVIRAMKRNETGVPTGLGKLEHVTSLPWCKKEVVFFCSLAWFGKS